MIAPAKVSIASYFLQGDGIVASTSFAPFIDDDEDSEQRSPMHELHETEDSRRCVLCSHVVVVVIVVECASREHYSPLS